jgi:hypothetical protein
MVGKMVVYTLSLHFSLASVAEKQSIRGGAKKQQPLRSQLERADD